MHRLALLLLCSTAAAPAVAQRSEIEALRAELARTRAALDAQERRLRALETRAPVGVPPPATAAPPVVASSSTVPGDPATVATAQNGSVPTERVGEAPAGADEAPAVAVLGEQGSAITRAGQLTGELQFEYARADRNRVLFRGTSLIDVLLVGAFDINESRQDVLTAAGSLRFGVTSDFEIGARVPYIYRSDGFALIDVTDPNRTVGTDVPSSADGNGIGDVEVSARYQLTRARNGSPFLIANLQAVAPTGTDPFEVRRNELGAPLEAATGAGFWGVSPSVTAILPTDPAVLFGTLGYTKNFSRNVDALIGNTRLTRIEPGDAVSASAGIGISLNQRTSINLGYAHSWSFGTTTTQRTRIPARPAVAPRPAVPERPAVPATPTSPAFPAVPAQAAVPGQAAVPESFVDGVFTSRDLQLGRLLFGVTYRVNDRASINWAVEVGATDDATDLRTVLRIPLILLTGR